MTQSSSTELNILCKKKKKKSLHLFIQLYSNSFHLLFINSLIRHLTIVLKASTLGKAQF